LKGKLLVFTALTVFVLCLPLLVTAQTETIIWRDDLSYQSFDQMQTAGWTSEHVDGVSFGSNGVILDQTHGDTAIHYIGHFASGIYNWEVKDSSRWVSGDHSGNIVSVLTEKHSYAFMADGWYSQFAFYHDGSKVYRSEKGTFSENKGVSFTLSMVKIGSQINCYYNGQLEYTYIESDSTPSQLNGVDAVSPWRGSSEYDYFQLSSASVFPSSVSPQSDNILGNPFVIGGIVGGVGIGVGLGVYFGFFAGGSAASSAGASAGTSGSIIQGHPPSPPSGGESTSPSDTSNSLSQGLGPFAEQLSNITDINNFWNDFAQDPTGSIFSVEPADPSYGNSPNTAVGEGSPSETPQEFNQPSNFAESITQLLQHGDQLATEAYQQGKLDSDGYQHYLEQSMQIQSAAMQAIQQMGQSASDAISGSDSR
jgi:hypothetical protein